MEGKARGSSTKRVSRNGTRRHRASRAQPYERGKRGESWADGRSKPRPAWTRRGRRLVGFGGPRVSSSMASGRCGANQRSLTSPSMRLPVVWEAVQMPLLAGGRVLDFTSAPEAGLGQVGEAQPRDQCRQRGG